MKTVTEYLGNNPYPGRGVLIGTSEDGRSVAAYFIMGRSENSKNRVFVQEGEALRTKAFDPAKMKDPSLIIYYPVRELNGTTIVTNGDQTDTVYDFFKKGGSFEDALMTRVFEPDAPNYTPRISGLLMPCGSFALSVLKAEDNDPERGLRAFFHYEKPKPGTARVVHTYSGDGNPLPPFAGEPVSVAVSGNIDDFTKELWNALNPDYRVSLFVRFFGEKGERETRIVNANE